ncbi:hypothetical protein [Streptomyces sp. NPDC101149]|uniref:hypothetical protein n=1 Tax=Streptomyces sp. NPDC101149 TaxID=3366113 RepID=UPI00382C4935
MPACSLPPGITRDLEATASAGIEGVHHFEVSDRMPAGPVVKTPALFMQQLVWSETFVSGGKAVDVQLSRWSTRTTARMPSPWRSPPRPAKRSPVVLRAYA